MPKEAVSITLIYFPQHSRLSEVSTWSFFCESEDIKTVVLSLAQRYKVSLTIKHLPIQQHPDYALTRQMTENIRPENFKIWADAFKGSGNT